MDFWINNEEIKVDSNILKKEDPGQINFEDFQNFDNEVEEKEKSEDLLQSQDFENSINNKMDNLFSQDDFDYHFQPTKSNQNMPIVQQNVNNIPQSEIKKIQSLKEIKEEKKIDNDENRLEPNHEIYCRIHEEEGGFFYCKNCKSFNICVQCIVSGVHKNHNVINLKNNQLTLKQKYDEIRNKLKEKNEELERKEKYISEKMNSSKNTLDHNKHVIGVHFQEIRINLEKKEKLFNQKIEELSNKSVINMKNSSDLIRKNINNLEDNIKKLDNLYVSNEYSLYKLILEGNLDSLIKDANLQDQNLINTFNKSEAQEEESFNKILMKINKYLSNIIDSLENEIFEEKVDLSEFHEELKKKNNDLFEIIYAPFDEQRLNINNLEEKTILVSLPKPQDSLNPQEKDHANKKSFFKNINELSNINVVKSFNENHINTLDKNFTNIYKKNTENQFIEYKENKSDNLIKLRNEIKSLSPRKRMLNEYQNPFSSTTSSHKEINHFDQYKYNTKLNSASNPSGHNKTIVIKKSYIETDLNMKNSFLSNRTLFKKNFMKESKFYGGVEDLRANIFELDRSQRLKHFQNISKSQMDKLTFKKNKKYVL